MKILNLKNDLILVELDAETGSIVSVTDLVRNSKVILKSSFTMTAEDYEFCSCKSAVALISNDSDHAEFNYEDDVFAATLKYTIQAEGAFIERQLDFYRKDGMEWRIKSLVCDNYKFSDMPNEIYLHDDQTLWHVPTVIFARYNGGGLYFGLEYPYWDYEADENSGFTLGFSPNYLVPAGEKFVSEKTFLGVYKAEGIKRYSHGPFPGKKKFKYPDVIKLEYSGLKESFKDFKMPEDVGITPEILDFGEVWAVQKFFEYHLPLLPLPEDGYFMWLNGWWAGFTSPDVSLLPPLKEVGIHDVEMASMYIGYDSHPCTEPRYITDMRIEPLGFPIYADDDGTGDTTVPTEFHHETKAVDNGKIIGYTDEFTAPKDYDMFISEAKKMGIHVTGFETPNTYFQNKPEWGSIDKNGKTHTYIGTRVSCPACKEFMDFKFEILCKIIDKYSCRFWAMDGRWLSYNEFECFGKEKIGPDPCYSDKHGHVPGDCAYIEWKNIEEFKAKLRKRYPKICFEQYYGLKRGGVWSMTNANSDENIYECSGADNNRFQTWFNENTRLRPVYINYTPIVGQDPLELEYSLISSLSTSSYAQISKGYAVLRNFPKSRDIFKRWQKWGSDHLLYLLHRRCIFGYPGDTAIDGSAHIIGGEGYIFAFSTTDNYVDARIILNHWIGLSEDKDAKYKITIEGAVRCADEPGANADPAECLIPSCVKHGETLRFRVSPKTAVIIHIEKTDSGIPDQLSDDLFKEDDIVENAFDIDLVL